MSIKHFTPKELFGPFEPTWEQIAALQALAEKVLEPARLAWGKSIKVNSALRSPEHNKAIGGAQNSQHMSLGPWAAAALTAGSREDNRKLFELIKARLPFDQLILEGKGAWVHVSYRGDGKGRGQAWEA